MVAVELHHLAQVGHELHAPAAVGDLEQAHVETLVRGEEAVALSHARLELLVQCVELGQLRVGGVARHHDGGVALKQCQQVVDLGQVTFRDFGDVSPAPQFHRDQAFRGQHLQRFAQRRAADAEFRGEQLLVDPAARRQAVRHDPHAQLLGHLLVERALRQARRSGAARAGKGCCNLCSGCGHRAGQGFEVRCKLGESRCLENLTEHIIQFCIMADALHAVHPREAGAKVHTSPVGARPTTSARTD